MPFVAEKKRNKIEYYVKSIIEFFGIKPKWSKDIVAEYY